MVPFDLNQEYFLNPILHNNISHFKDRKAVRCLSRPSCDLFQTQILENDFEKLFFFIISVQNMIGPIGILRW